MTTHTETVKSLAALSGATYSQTDTIIRSYLDSHSKRLRADGRTRLNGIGILELVQRKQKNGRNPRTGAPVLIPARMGVRFRKSVGLVL